MLLSVIVYTLLALALWYLGYHVHRREQRLYATSGATLPGMSWEIWLAIALVTVVIGFRWDTGSDFEMYYQSFKELADDGEFSRRDNFEVGYYYFNKFLAVIGCHPIVVFAVWTFVQAFLFYFALRDRKFLLPWMGLLLILGPLNLNWLTFLRQWTISFMLLASIPWIVNRKWLPYLLMVALAITIHKSAILLLPLYFAPCLVRDKDRTPWLYLVIFAACVVLGQFPYWFKALRWVVDAAYMAGYDRYHYLLDPLKNLQYHFYSWGPAHICSVLVSALFIWFYPSVRRHYPADKFLPTYFVLAFLCVCYDNLVLNTSYVLRRPADYLYVFQWVMLAYTMAYFKETKRYVLLAATIAVSCATTYFILYKCAYMGIEDKMLYHFFFFK